jgi:Uncharacterized protein, putative amidase
MDKVLWSELLPYEFKRRIAETPIVYLPLGICEPHGQIAAFGLDTLKAEWLCEQAAWLEGGIVAPALGYQMHEAGFHARWLEDTVGEHNAHMTGMPPHVMLYFFLYQLRSFANAGFRGIVVVSGHSGGNQEDYRRAAALFEDKTGIRVRVVSDPELVAGLHEGDHAGKYEISQLLYLRPELVDMSKASLADEAGCGGALAIGDDAMQADAGLGERIMKDCLKALAELVEAMKESIEPDASRVYPSLTYDDMEPMMGVLMSKRSEWTTVGPRPGQQAVSDHSQWKSYEYAMKSARAEGMLE